MLDFSDVNAMPYTETRARTFDRHGLQQASLIVDSVDSVHRMWIDDHHNMGSEEATGATSQIF